jgi:hypothetical protein
LVIDEQGSCKDIVYYLLAMGRVWVENIVDSTKINKNKLLKKSVNICSQK